MSYLRSYINDSYEVTQYTGGGTVRDRLTDNIVAEYTNYWTEDGVPHPQAIQQVRFINEKFDLNIKLE